MWLETDSYIIELLGRNGTFYKVFVPALEFSQVQLTFLLTFSLRNILTKHVFSEGGGGGGEKAEGFASFPPSLYFFDSWSTTENSPCSKIRQQRLNLLKFYATQAEVGGL